LEIGEEVLIEVKDLEIDFDVSFLDINFVGPVC
jgi:hypothetical protein